MTSDEVSEFLSAVWSIEVVPPPTEVPKSFNLAAGQLASVAISRDEDDDKLFLSGLTWGIDAFSPPNRPPKKPINARIETASVKPTLRRLFRSNRCIVPASGYFEWKQSAASSKKQPYFIHQKDGSEMFFAGLWSPTRNESPSSFVILTTEAKDHLREVHNRMPVILQSDDALQWVMGELELTGEVVTEKIVTHGIAMTQVSTKVNNPKNNSADLLEPQSEIPGEQGIF
jgi:putative SOS response-associated peptidase YedK